MLATTYRGGRGKKGKGGKRKSVAMDTHGTAWVGWRISRCLKGRYSAYVKGSKSKVRNGTMNGPAFTRISQKEDSVTLLDE